MKTIRVRPYEALDAVGRRGSVAPAVPGAADGNLSISAELPDNGYAENTIAIMVFWLRTFTPRKFAENFKIFFKIFSAKNFLKIFLKIFKMFQNFVWSKKFWLENPYCKGMFRVTDGHRPSVTLTENFCRYKIFGFAKNRDSAIFGTFLKI